MKNLVSYLKNHFKDINLKEVTFSDIAGAASKSRQNQ